MKVLGALWAASVALVPVVLNSLFPSGRQGNVPHTAVTNRQNDHVDTMTAVANKLDHMTMAVHVAEPINLLDEVAVLASLDLFFRQGFQGKK
jgi:hypothetical protein